MRPPCDTPPKLPMMPHVSSRDVLHGFLDAVIEFLKQDEVPVSVTQLAALELAARDRKLREQARLLRDAESQRLSRRLSAMTLDTPD